MTLPTPTLSGAPQEAQPTTLAAQRFHHVLRVAAGAGEHDKMVQVLAPCAAWVSEAGALWGC